MIQSIYAAVSNGNNVHCGKRIPKYQAQPIPLMKSNYLGEFRTQLEKAKARKNLGIGDEFLLTWGNITGHIEDNKDLTTFIENQWKYEYVSPYIQQEIKNVKQALDYALYYVSTYEANDEAVHNLSQKFDTLTSHVDEVQEQLQNNINLNSTRISDIQNNIQSINKLISDINEDLKTINVDENIYNWVKQNLEQSSTIYFKEITNDEEATFQIIEVKISQEEKNALIIKEDGIYVEDFSKDINDIKQHQGYIDKSLVDLKYNTELPDSTTSTTHKGITVQQLKNKSMSKILDEVLFPAEVRDLVMPTISYSDIEDLVEINTPVYFPKIEYLAGDAGETISQTNILTFRGLEYTEDYYSNVGTYVFTGTIQYSDGEYLKNNREEVTDIRVESGEISTTKNVKVTYPWFAGSTEDGVQKQILVPVNEVSGYIDISLSKHAVIKIPGAKSTLNSFRVDSGLGYLDVDISGWEQTQEYINGVPYKVWTKKDEYVAILPHKVNFTIIA